MRKVKNYRNYVESEQPLYRFPKVVKWGVKTIGFIVALPFVIPAVVVFSLAVLVLEVREILNIWRVKKKGEENV